MYRATGSGRLDRLRSSRGSHSHPLSRISLAPRCWALGAAGMDSESALTASTLSTPGRARRADTPVRLHRRPLRLEADGSVDTPRGVRRLGDDDPAVAATIAAHLPATPSRCEARPRRRCGSSVPTFGTWRSSHRARSPGSRRARRPRRPRRMRRGLSRRARNRRAVAREAKVSWELAATGRFARSRPVARVTTCSQSSSLGKLSRRIRGGERRLTWERPRREYVVELELDAGCRPRARHLACGEGRRPSRSRPGRHGRRSRIHRAASPTASGSVTRTQFPSERRVVGCADDEVVAVILDARTRMFEDGEIGGPSERQLPHRHDPSRVPGR